MVQYSTEIQCQTHVHKQMTDHNTPLVLTKEKLWQYMYYKYLCTCNEHFICCTLMYAKLNKLQSASEVLVIVNYSSR